MFWSMLWTGSARGEACLGCAELRRQNGELRETVATLEQENFNLYEQIAEVVDQDRS